MASPFFRGNHKPIFRAGGLVVADEERKNIRLFLSAVTDEFLSYREQLRHDLTRHNVEVKIQEDFKDRGNLTLEKLDDYIKHCDAVIHLVGNMTGTEAKPFSTQEISKRYPDLPQKLRPLKDALAQDSAISYTQWEAWLALYHGKKLLIAAATEEAPREQKYAHTETSVAAQKAHLARLRQMERYPAFNFKSPDNLIAQIYSTFILELLVEAGPPNIPRNLPFISLGSLFKGRNIFLQTLHESLNPKGDGKTIAITSKALHGLGGVGKTRAAVEYAWQKADAYSAVLFVPAETSAKLEAGLASLAGVLDLKEKNAKEDAEKIKAVLDWLDTHPTWLMIFDNVDDRAAAEAVENFLHQHKNDRVLINGRVLITGRNADFTSAIGTLPLDVLETADATEFLLERTENGRSKTPQDAPLAQQLAEELGGLALALEQAGAYICKQRIGFERYLTLWQQNRAKVLGEFDPKLIAYDHDVGLAATWVTTVEKLTPNGLRLLQRLSFMAPEPIPESLLDVAIPGEPADFDAFEARADLFAYSMISRAKLAGGTAKEEGFAVHRLVQDFTRGRLDRKGIFLQLFRYFKQKSGKSERFTQVLQEALNWVNNAFIGDPQDVREWPKLDPLVPHILILTHHADEANILEPTAQLLSKLNVQFSTKARYAEVEPLMRRALEIDEATFGPDHPDVARDLNNLAQLLQNTNRLAEAEPLMRRALEIDEASFGPDHPLVALSLTVLAGLLKETSRVVEAEPLMRRALAIGEANFGLDHPKVPTGLGSLAELLKVTNRPGEAEPLMRRALSIDEANYGPNHPNVAIRLNNLALLLKNTKRLAEAEPLYRRALAITEATFGLDHPLVGTLLNNLASLLKDTKRSVEAEPLYRRALAISEANYGPDHPNVALDLNNLALLLQNTNRLVEAEPLMSRNVEILLKFTAQTGHQHPNLMTAFQNYSSLLTARRFSNKKASAVIETLAKKYGLTLPTNLTRQHKPATHRPIT